MTDRIDQAIEKLVADAAPVRMAQPWRSFLVWAAVTTAASLVLASFSSLRADLAEQSHSPLWLAEVATLFVLILSAAMSAVWLCFPDLRQKPWVMGLLLPPLAVYAGLMIFRATHPEMTQVLPKDAHNDFDCVLCITIYSLVPSFWMFRTLRKHATTHPKLAGVISLLTAASIGVLMLKFFEANDSVLHLIEWHLIPVALFGVIGAYLGKRLLRW